MPRYPGLLAPDLTEKARLEPMSGSLTFKMTGAGEAEMTLPEDAPAVHIHDWVSIYTNKGLAGIYRVTNAAQNYNKQIDITLLHGRDVLSDSVWSAQTEFSGTRAQYLTALLNQQTVLINGAKPWVLGTCHDLSEVKKDINFDRLSDLLEEMEDEAGDYYFTYDQSSFPWVINYVEKPMGRDCEFRLARNVRTATVTYNDADLCTRLHLSVNVEKKDAETDTTTTDTRIKTYDNAQAQAIWGIVEKTADIDTADDLTQETLPEADAWAANFLYRRQSPSVQIQIDGDELAAQTGDTWDEYSVGRRCQAALPDYGQSFVERVVSVSYPELYKDPEHVTVSLANALPQFSETLTDARKQADLNAKKVRSVGRSAAKDKDLLTWSQITKYYGTALDGTGVLTLYESGIDMSATGGVRIFSLQEGLQSLYAGIEVTASQIRAEVSQGLSGLHSELVMTASQIKAEVDDSLSGIASFVIQADQIRSEVQDALSNLGTLVVESSQIRAEVRNALSDIAEFKVTASQIRAEVADALSRVATLEITSSQIRAEVSDALSHISTLIVESSQIRAEVTDALSNIATLVVESSQIRAEVLDALSNVASFVIDASQIRGEVADALSNVATLVIEADSIRTEVTDALSNVSALIVEASQIRAEVQDGLSNMAAFVVSANQIKAEVENAMSQAASFVVEASQIRAAVSDAESRIASLEIAASAINISVSNAQSRLGAVEVQAGRVSMVVGSDNKIKAGVIVDAINDTSTALISADRITLDGTTTVSGVLNISGGTMVVSKLANFSEDVTITSGKTLSVGNIQFVGSQQGERYNLTGGNVGNLITELQVASSGSTYWLEKKTVYNSNTWTKVENSDFERGSAAEISGAWSGATYTATASGATPVTTTVGMTGAGQQDSFTVSAYHDGVITDTVNSINGFLVVTSSSTKANNKAEVRLIAKTGVSSVLVSSLGLGDVYDKGAAAVTLSEAWSNGKYTVTASNSKTKSVTIGVTAAGTNQPNFTIAAYTGAATNTIRSDYVYLVENASQKRVEAHLSTTGGTTVGQVSTSATYNAGKADVTLSEAWNGNKYTVTASNGKTKSVSIGMTGNGQNDSFTVSAYKNNTTTDTANSISGYLIVTSSSTRANNKVEARLGARSGTGSILVGSVTLGDVYDAGKNAVTISGSWAYDDTGVFTYTASNSATKTTTIHLTTKRMGDGNTSTDHFPVWVYNGNSTANNIIERSIYLTEEVSTARSNCRVLAHWNSASGDTYGRVFTPNIWDAGANAVTLSRTISGNHIQVNASNGKQSNTYVNLAPSGEGQTSFTVSAYYGSETTNTLISRYIYLTETASSTRSKCKVQARWNSATGTVYGEIPTTDTYDKGVASVTLSEAWSNNKYTVTASNSKTKSVTIGLTGDGQNDSFTVSAYYGSSTSNTVKSINGYLVVSSSSTKANNKAEVRLNARTGSSSVLVGSVSLGDVWQAGYDAHTASHSITVSGVSSQPGSASTGSRTCAISAGISRPPAYGYVFFTVNCSGTSKSYYIPINT